MTQVCHPRLAVILLVLSACSALEPGQTPRTLVIADRKEECSGPFPQLCILFGSPGRSELLRHYGGIEGFQYEWGYVYEIEVTDHTIIDPPADSPGRRTVLGKIVSKERVAPGTEFDMFLTGLHVTEVAPDRYRFHHEAEFVCPAGADCGELRTQILAGARLRYRFEHPAAPGDPLLLRRWERCSAALVGSSLCTAGG